MIPIPIQGEARIAELGFHHNGDKGILAARTVLPGAGRSWLQIVHAGGGLQLESDNHSRVLEVFADHSGSSSVPITMC
jgi:hypothetical protein